MVGDTVEFTVRTADMPMTGVVLGTLLMPFFGHSTFSVWTDAYGGRAFMLKLAPGLTKSAWRLLHRPSTLEEARDRMMKARASYELQQQEMRRHGS